MGCMCAKASSAIEDSQDSPKGIELNKRASELAAARARSSRAVSTKRGESFRLKERLENGGGNKSIIGMIDKKANGSRRVRDDDDHHLHDDKKRGNSGLLVNYHPGNGTVPKAVEGEQVAAGWPNWLVAVAGEAIKGWLPRKADTFEKLDKIGQGTYSSVYKARDLLHNKVVALKRVRFDNLDPESIKFMAREIVILRRLDHPNIIKLEGLVTSRSACSLYLVFEYMEHDLTGLAALPGAKFTEPQVKCYMHQLLSGLDHCHTHGVLHRDIKGSNLLVDNHGILKIADFGLATFFDHRQSVPLTSRVVTLWYRPPELLLGASHYAVAVDLWSTGCILGELYAGKPIMPGRTEVEQLHKIFKLCGSPSEDYWRKSKLPHSTVFKPLQPYRRRLTEAFKDLPPAAIGLLDTLLSIDPERRGTAASALKSEFFTTKPFACDPSSLPKYPPSKEIDAKLREEEARRHGAMGDKGLRGDHGSRGSKELRVFPAPDANAELAKSMQRRQGQVQVNPKSRSEVFNMHKEESASGFPIDPPRPSRAAKESSKDILQHPSQRFSHSGPLAPGIEWTNFGKNYDGVSLVSTRGDLSTLSGLVASRGLLSEQSRDKYKAQPEAPHQVERVPESLEETARKQDRRRNTQKYAGSYQMEHGRLSAKEPVSVHEARSNKVHFSGPLLVPSNNVDQMLKDHERHVQEAARRARLERNR